MSKQKDEKNTVIKEVPLSSEIRITIEYAVFLKSRHRELFKFLSTKRGDNYKVCHKKQNILDLVVM